MPVPENSPDKSTNYREFTTEFCIISYYFSCNIFQREKFSLNYEKFSLSCKSVYTIVANFVSNYFKIFLWGIAAVLAILLWERREN